MNMYDQSGHQNTGKNTLSFYTTTSHVYNIDDDLNRNNVHTIEPSDNIKLKINRTEKGKIIFQFNPESNDTTNKTADANEVHYTYQFK